MFRIKHFAGSVTYSVSGFLAKNTDSLDISISRSLFSFNHPLIKTLFPEGKNETLKEGALTKEMRYGRGINYIKLVKFQTNKIKNSQGNIITVLCS